MYGMRRRLAAWGIGLCLGIGTAQPALAELQVTSETLFRVFERKDETTADKEVLPLYEYLSVAAGDLGEPGISLRLSGWGRSDLAGSDYYTDPSEGELLAGYLQYVHASRRLSLQLGRFPLTSGVTHDTIDGLAVQTLAIPHLSLSVYGGQPAAYDDTQGRGGDSIYGGRLALLAGRGKEIGVSLKESRNDGTTVTSLLGVDLAWLLPAEIWLGGFSSYNRDVSGWAEHAYELRIPIKQLILSPFYETRNYAELFGSNPQAIPLPFRLLAQSDDTITSYGSNVQFQLGDAWEIEARYKRINQDRADTSAHYAAALLSWHGKRLTATGIEGGRMQGETDADRYFLGRLFFYLDGLGALLPQGFLSADLSVVSYAEEIYGKDQASFASLSFGHRFWRDTLNIKLAGDYSDDPYFDQDLRGLLLVTYLYDRPSEVKK